MNENLEASATRDELIVDRATLRQHTHQVLLKMPVIDMHTHLYAPQFGALDLWGIDELLTYHYLIAELFRSADIRPTEFWKLSKTAQADLIWETLFVRNTPISEATRGVVRVLRAFGLDTRAKDLREVRRFFREQTTEAHLDRVLEMANVSDIVMTNDPFDEGEARIWTSGEATDKRFHAALRLDGILNDWPRAVPKIVAQGFNVAPELTQTSIVELRKFLDAWIGRIKPLYMAVSLPDDFNFPEDSARHRLIEEAVLPTAQAHDLPFALMIGVRRAVNPAIRLAGDGLGRADVRAVERLCAEHSDVRFLVTMLSRENQHELCVAARKFSNLMIFGCWWFLNNPSIVAEITRERFELLGPSFIPQHSDARVLDQLIYKWQHARRIIADALCESYEHLLDDGRGLTPAEIERDAARLLRGNFQAMVNLPETTERAIGETIGARL